ncbi:MAG: hypothetical protein K0R51_2377 [Cytophagaceae bacterium]|jgi:hypothetical protein|nr:hypothetical protein [Cytophagaceae bacterium]
MKKHIIFSAAVLAFCFAAFTSHAQGRGQENNTPESKANKAAVNLQSKLSLTEDQKNKVYELNLVTIKDTRALKVAKRNDMSGVKEGYTEIHQQYDQAMKGILSANQYDNWKKIQSEARSRKQKEITEQTGKKGKFNANEEDPEEEMTWEESED